MGVIEYARVMLAGESFWKVQFTNNHELSELDRLSVPVWKDGKAHYLIRRAEWLEDLIGSGDIRRVKAVMLVTPQGTAHIPVLEPYTVFQLSQGVQVLLTGEKVKQMQMIGVVADKDTGECECAIWDVAVQQLYTGRNNIKNVHAWREGVAPLGRLALEVLDLRGIG